MFYSWLWFCVRKFDLKGKILAFCLPHKECSHLSLFLVRLSFLLLSQDFLGSPVAETLCFHCSGAQAWSLVGELGPHMPHSVDQKLKTKNTPEPALVRRVMSVSFIYKEYLCHNSWWLLYLHRVLDDSHFWQSHVVGDMAFSIFWLI